MDWLPAWAHEVLAVLQQRFGIVVDLTMLLVAYQAVRWAAGFLWRLGADVQLPAPRYQRWAKAAGEWLRARGKRGRITMVWVLAALAALGTQEQLAAVVVATVLVAWGASGAHSQSKNWAEAGEPAPPPAEAA